MNLATLEKEVLGLNRRSRKDLAHKLLRSLDEDIEEQTSFDEDISEEWLREIERRNKEIDENPSIMIPGEKVMQEMRDLLK